MKSLIIREIGQISSKSLFQADLPKPVPKADEVLIKVHFCGICHTEIDEIEGRTPPVFFPIIPGHQNVGFIEEIGSDVRKFRQGDRAGVGWIWSACGQCNFCRKGQENLCPDFKATGRDVNGGYAEYMTAKENYAHHIPETIPLELAAPLLCAGSVGYRSLKMANICDGDVLGLTGFGASGHLVLQMAKFQYPNSDILVFARSPKEREFALHLGATWAGDISEHPPRLCQAIIDTTPVWKPVVDSLLNLQPGGRLVINAIRKEGVDHSYLSNLDFARHLWMEKEIKSVANVTGEDIRNCLKIADQAQIKPQIELFDFEKANQALMEIKKSKINGAKVLRIV